MPCRWDETGPPMGAFAVNRRPRSPPLLAKIPFNADGGRARSACLATTSLLNPSYAKSSSSS